MHRALANSAELRETVLYLVGLQDPEAQERFDSVPVPELPGIPRRNVPSFRRHDSLNRVLVALSAVMATVALVVLWKGISEPPARWTQVTQLNVEILENDPQRGGPSEELLIPANPEEAAILAFRNTAKWSNGSLLPEPSRSPDNVGQPVDITLIGSDDVYRRSIPEGAQQTEVWFLGLSSLMSYRTITITYLKDHQFGATAAGEIKKNSTQQ
jgi:hypothetical protein